MSAVNFVEVVLENGVFMTFEENHCSVILDAIEEKTMSHSGNFLYTKTASVVELQINKHEHYDEAFEDIQSEDNILSINLIQTDEQGKIVAVDVCHVGWAEGDVDENSYQRSFIDADGNLQVTIKKENSKT